MTLQRALNELLQLLAQVNYTHTSRTTSGSISVRSSGIRSLQQTPSARAFLAHLAAEGASMPGAALSMGHTGGFLDFAGVSWRFGRMHAVGVEETEETELREEDMVAQIFCPITACPPYISRDVT